MNFSRAASRRTFSVELTPMIDVVFLLIIFFMTTAKFLSEARAELDLPQQPGEQLDTPQEAGIVINLTSAGRLVISDREIDFDALDRTIEDEILRRNRQNESVKVTIRADRNADSQYLNELITRLRELEVAAARIATEVP